MHLEQLDAHFMCVVVVYAEHASQVFKDLVALQHIIVDVKLAAEHQCQLHM